MEVKGRVTLMQCQRWWYVANATALLRCWISISLAGVRGCDSELEADNILPELVIDVHRVFCAPAVFQRYHYLVAPHFCDCHLQLLATVTASLQST